MSEEHRVLILGSQEANFKIERMACEIMEDIFHESEVILLGIDWRGRNIAEKIARHIRQASSVRIRILEAQPTRQGYSSSEIRIPDLKSEEIRNKPLVIIDDVLYSGKTLLLTISQILSAQPSSVRVGVLIDRGHRNYPIHADYTGMELATTLQNHVRVEIDSDENIQGYLFS